jgi:hypothetical protein
MAKIKRDRWYNLMETMDLGFVRPYGTKKADGENQTNRQNTEKTLEVIILNVTDGTI